LAFCHLRQVWIYNNKQDTNWRSVTLEMTNLRDCSD